MAALARRGLRRLLRRGVPLRLLLTASFVSLLVAAVGITGWLLIRNSRRGVEAVEERLRRELTGHVHEFVTEYLETPHRINRINADLIRRGLLDPRDSAALGRHFFHQLGEFETVSFVFLGTPGGGAAGAGRTAEGIPIVDSTPADPLAGLLAGPRTEFRAGPGGERGELLRSTPGFDARERPWYRAAVERGGPVWSGVYPFFADATLAVAASQPVAGPDGEPLAVLGADLALGRIGAFLRGLRVGDHGHIFVVERSGLLIATSAAEAPLGGGGTGAGAGARRHAAASAEPLVASTARFLGEDGLAAIDGPLQLAYRLDGERRLVDVLPFSDPRGLDWLIVSAVPESDFTGAIEASTRATLWLCLGALAAALAAAVLIARAVSLPVRRLTRASREIAGGRLDRRVEVAGRVEELDHLARSFNRMAARLGRSFEELEARVAARTAELRGAKEAADAASRAKGDFLATVSHELRQPLAAILGYTELLADGGAGGHAGPGGEEAARALATIRDNGEYLARLVDDLLDLEAIEAGRLDLEDEVCDLAELLTQLHDTAAPRARARGLTLALAAEGRLPRRFTACRLRLRQVLANLLSNAVKYTERGRVTLTVRAAGESGAEGGERARTALAFEVADTGPGIPPEDHERLFRPFTRLGGGEGDGFGLGLAIARRLVERMGGTIALESSPGAGARFRVEVPVTDASAWGPGAALWAPPEAPDPAPPPRRLSGRVLIADDSRDLRELFERVLGRWGLETESVADGREAVERAAAGGFDVLLVDWRMPGLEGLAAVAELRRRGVEVPVIALTAAASAADRERSLATGCAAHLPKPVDFRRLRAALAAVLQGETGGERGRADGGGAASSADDAGRWTGRPPSAEGRRAGVAAASSHAAATTAGGDLGRSAAASSAVPAGWDPDAPSGDTAAVELEVAFLAGRYLRRLPAKVEGLRSALAAGDWAGLYAAAHQLAGTAGSFGLAEVADLAAALEDAGARSDRAAAGPVVERLGAAVEARLASLPGVDPGGPPRGAEEAPA